MSRDRSPRNDDDLHARFTAWLYGGPDGDPPRDAAVHAAHCLRCRAAMTALDHLLVIDLGRAPLPPSRGIAPRRVGALVRPRLLAATAASVVVVASMGWIGAGLLAPGLFGGATETPSTDQGVLGGFGAGGSATPGPEASFGGVTSGSGGATPATTPAVSADEAVDSATAAPATAQPIPPTPPPSVAKSSVPTAGQSRTPAPIATPTPMPSPTPTPVAASPSPSASSGPLPECADLIDNDGDGAIDFAGVNPDPECTSALDDDEAD